MNIRISERKKQLEKLKRWEVPLSPRVSKLLFRTTEIETFDQLNRAIKDGTLRPNNCWKLGPSAFIECCDIVGLDDAQILENEKNALKLAKVNKRVSAAIKLLESEGYKVIVQIDKILSPLQKTLILNKKASSLLRILAFLEPCLY